MTTLATAPLPTVGAEAPGFVLDSTTGSKVSLAEFRGTKHVLLAFFPLAFTSTCTAEMCAFSDDYAAFAAEDVVVIPISVDSVASLKEYKAKYNMGVQLASDFKREVSRAYGVLNEERFLARRSYFLVDKAGILRWSFVEEHGGHRRENAELLAEIAKLRA
ncbi:MAG: redoxin domain-containing protein [Gemmatimonadetes bacterium]|nr:redoxin domain-containing protein [Gemmatimonadota bacterium]